LAAIHQVHRAADDGVQYVRSRAARPDLLKRDAARAGGQWNKDLNPAATPVADTFAGELARRFGIGMNQGQALYDVGTIVLPVAGEVKGAAELGRFAKAGSLKYIRMSATPEQAAYLAERDFKTVGHHSIVPQRAKLVRQVPAVQNAANSLGLPQLPGKLFGDLPVPKFFSESAFNIVKPKGVERGMLYKRHYGLDDLYYGGKISAEFGGGGWSGQKLGWTRYGPVERLWYGTPGRTKAIGLGAPATLDALGRVAPDDEDTW
jgi:hypothetical protein